MRFITVWTSIIAFLTSIMRKVITLSAILSQMMNIDPSLQTVIKSPGFEWIHVTYTTKKKFRPLLTARN
jgi:hypothetical protein